jgi:hypothetical protein
MLDIKLSSILYKFIVGEKKPLFSGIPLGRRFFLFYR